MQDEVYTKYFLLLLFQMKTFYPFITSSDFLSEPPITLGLDLNKDCIGQQVKKIFFLQFAWENGPPGKRFVLASIGNFLGCLNMIRELRKSYLKKEVRYYKWKTKVTRIQINNMPKKCT